jgi:L-ribulose-5-phosphate 3-epimerase
MQGRLSPSTTGKIQEFPIKTWQDEFEVAARLGLNAIEWTVDFQDYRNNPIFISELNSDLNYLITKNRIHVPSITLDCFVEAPIHAKNELTGLKSEINDLIWVAENIRLQGLNVLVLPIVAEAGAFTEEKMKNLVSLLNGAQSALADLGKKVAIECEFQVPIIKKLLEELDSSVYGINFDMGNSAALGNSAVEEITACRDRIFNVHVKDRILGGKTVPLGHGSVDFDEVSKSLQDIGYMGNMIMQAARDFNRPEIQVISEYISFCKDLGWVND